MADIVLINPKFEISYWGLENALSLLGKRANLPTACLPLLAALTPSEHQVTLIDENIQPLDFERLRRADIIGLTGMSVQRHRMRAILEELQGSTPLLAVGGPWVTVRENDFDGLVDVVFVGEAEDTWPRFLNEWHNGMYAARYEQTERTDMTRVPPPRTELLPADQYLFGSIQFSRGCPFQCEFCDIIVTFGRRPRLKTSEQILHEFDALRRNRVETAFVVDDNLIGNKVAIKRILKDLAQWQARHGYPLTLFSEASIDLADDRELMELMVEANFVSIFVGIETPNELSLRETKKLQNLRTEHTLTEKVHAIQAAGLDVWCGLIVGFDHDDVTVFDLQYRFLEESRISHAMLGMLTAIPKTPLYDRLLADGRIDEENEADFGTNILPAGMTREVLRDGYLRLQADIHEPHSYFDRLDRLYLDGAFRFGQARAAYWRRHRGAWLRCCTRDLMRSAGIFFRLMHQVRDPELRAIYRSRVMNLVRRRPNPAVIFVYVLKCAIHYHHYTMSQQMNSRQTRVVNTF